ncbi:hypothetical protein [Hyphomonas oceanitis]|uniref:hypothetical protein n=1 Tax=Hyphomonas oceanitis TaxID=81033 RepID=UPI003002E119
MTHPLTRTLFSLGLTALATCLPAAHAAPDSACPADAEQRLYDMETTIRQGTQKDPVAIVTMAEWAIETCPDRPDAQAIAATLMSAAVRTTNDLDVLDRYMTVMLTAIRQSDYAWNTKQDPSVLKQADGSEASYFGYSTATGVLTGTALPYLTAMAGSGRIHPAISGEPLGICPYADHSDSRLESEVSLWDKSIKGKNGDPIFTWAENRLTALHAACPTHRHDLDFYLARLYGQEVETLTHWNHNYMEAMNYGSGGYYWSNAFAGDPIFSEEKMQVKKAELDAKARPLAEKAKPYLAAFFYTQPGEDRTFDTKLDAAKVWRDAVEKLDAAPE